MDHLAAQLGLLMALVLALCLLFHTLRLSVILAYIAAGVAAHFVFNACHAHLDHALEHVLPEMGIILLLFCAGMEIDLNNLRCRVRNIAAIALVQIAGTITIGALIAVVFLGIRSPKPAIFVGLCLTFSSTVIVVQWLERRKQMDSLHGLVLLGVLVMQDLTAIVSLAILGSPAGESITAQFFGIGWRLVVVTFLVFVAGRYALSWLLNKCSRARELFFPAAFAWCFGIAGACHLANFSAELGAFLAGAAMANVRHYKLEIADKVEPLRDLGLILFFTALGMKLRVSATLLSNSLAIVAIIVACWAGKLLLVALPARATGLRKRTVFFAAVLPLQISEFSLVLATLCLKAGVFTTEIFDTITWAAIGTILFYSIASERFEFLYNRFGIRMDWLERGEHDPVEGLEEGDLNHHTVVMGYNAIGQAVTDALLERGEKVVVIDLDPDNRVEVRGKMHGREGQLGFVFGDAGDPDVWLEAGMARADRIVSSVLGGQTYELGILEWKRRHNPDALVVVAAETLNEERGLMEAGADYVLVPESLAAVEIRSLFARETSLQPRGKTTSDTEVGADAIL